jgi:hypothetical protein
MGTCCQVYGPDERIAQVVPDLVDGAIRPGCVELSIDFWLRSEEEYLAAKTNFEESLLAYKDAMPLWLKNADITLPDNSVAVSFFFGFITLSLHAPIIKVNSVLDI